MQQEPIDWRCLPYILGLFFRPIFQGIYPQFIWPEKWYVYVAPCIGSWNSHWYLETKRNIETLYKCVYNLGSCYPKIKWSWTHSPYKKKAGTSIGKSSAAEMGLGNEGNFWKQMELHGKKIWKHIWNSTKNVGKIVAAGRQYFCLMLFLSSKQLHTITSLTHHPILILRQQGPKKRHTSCCCSLVLNIHGK